MGKRSRMKRLERASRAQAEGASSSARPQPGAALTASATRTAGAVLLVAIFLAGVFLRLSVPEVSKRSPDERFYARYASAVAVGGIGAFKGLVAEYNKDRRMWMYPPPIRIGYIYPASVAMRMAGSMDVSALVRLSQAAGIISMAILAVIGLRFFNIWVTVFAMSFMAASPLELAMARRAWQDGFFGCLGLSVIYLCCEISRSPRRLIFYPLFFIAGAYLLLVKESGAVIYGIGCAWIAWVLFARERRGLRAAIFTALAAMAAVAAFLIQANICGGVGPVVELVKNTMSSFGHNEYAINYQSGPWYYYIKGLWMLNPLATVFFAVGVLAAALRAFFKKGIAGIDDGHLLSDLVIFAAVFIAIATIPQYLKNLRFISPVLGIFYLLGGFGFWYFVSAAAARAKGAILAAVFSLALITLILAASADYARFDRLFVKNGVVDLVNRQFMEALARR